MTNRIRILLLEDNPHDAELAERHLRRGGFEPAIKRVMSEPAFRSEVVAGNHDLILADYHLPDFNGMKALEIARELAPAVPFIFMSGSIGEERAIEALHQGAVDYIIKDRPSRLPSAINAALARKRERDSRKRMQDALVESEQRFHFVAMATRDVIWDWSVDDGRIWVNDALRSEWGYDFEDPQVDYEMWAGKIHPEDGWVTESLRRAMESTDERWSAEYRFRRADRTYGFVYDRRIIIRRPSGRSLRVIGAMQDVTSRKMFQMRADDAERLAHLGNFSRDRLTGRREWSAELYRILDFDPGQTVTDDMLLNRVHPDDRAFFQKAISGPDPTADFEYRIINRRQETHVLHARLVGEHDPDGNLIRIFGTLQDITDRTESENRIRDLSRINELILSNAAEGILAVSRGSELIFANPAAERLIGWEHGAAVSDVHAALHPAEDDSSSCPLLEDMRGGTARSSETTFATAAGQQLEVRYTSAAIVDDGEVTGSVLTFADITERKRLERQLEQVNRVSGLGRVAATIAHEFNNVLMGIQPFAEVIRRRSADEKVLKAAAQIATSVTRGKRVTEEILRFTQPAEPSRKPIEVGEWLQNMLPELQGLVGQRVEIALHLPDEPVTIQGDASQLQQVITNLVLNGRDAITGAGTITIRLHSRTEEEHFSFGQVPPGLALLTVRDTGSGMKPEVLDNIFEPLFTTKRTGTGLGLAVAQQVISRHGGSIHAESTVGKGTTFFIVLPTVSTSEVAESGADPQKRDTVVRRIVVVEDEEVVATGIALLLESEGVQVRVADHGAAAIETIEGFDPDAVVLDISLPDMDGPEVYRRIAAAYPTLPVLFSSGHGDQSSVEEYFKTERVAFLRKPYDLETLLAALEKITQKSLPSQRSK